MTFGERLKSLRSGKNETLEEVGKSVGVTRQYLSNIENDRTTPGKKVISSLADHFNVSVDFLLGKTDVRNTLNLDGIYKKGYEAGISTLSAIQKIPIYDPLSCGNGSWVEEYPEEFIGLPDGYLKTGMPLFANEACGDSMVPTIEPDDLLIFGQTTELRSGQIGSFGYEGEYYCKRYKDFNGDIWLYSDNADYEPIHITNREEFRILGVLKAQISKRNCR